MELELEREYFSLAGVMLLCLWHELHVGCDKFYCFVGYMDYATEMHMILAEELYRARSRPRP